jgi:hypothetical protein
MQKSNNLYALGFNPKNHDERGFADHKLAGAPLAPNAAHTRLLNQLIDLFCDQITLTDDCQGVVFVVGSNCRATVLNSSMPPV